MSNLCAFLIQYFAIDFLNFFLFVLIHYRLCHTQFVVKLIGQTLPPAYEGSTPYPKAGPNHLWSKRGNCILNGSKLELNVFMAKLILV